MENKNGILESFVKLLPKGVFNTIENIEDIGALNFNDEFIDRFNSEELETILNDAKIKKDLDVRKNDFVVFFSCYESNIRTLYLVVYPIELWSNDYIYKRISLD